MQNRRQDLEHGRIDWRWYYVATQPDIRSSLALFTVRMLALSGTKTKKFLPLFCRHNLKAWVTAMLFTEWLRQFFIPEVKEYLEKEGLPLKVLLVIDNAHGHPQSISIEDENLQVVFCNQTRPHCFSHSTRVSLGVSRPHTLVRSSRWFEQPLMPTLNVQSWTAGNPSPLLMQ